MNKSAIKIIKSLFGAISTGESPENIAKLFSEGIDWYIDGDLQNVPWIGKKKWT